MGLNKSQLVWRCRRGVRELDVLLGRFLDTEYAKLDNDEQSAFAEFLEVQDPVIMDWLFDKYSPDDPGVARIVDRLKALSITPAQG